MLFSTYQIITIASLLLSSIYSIIGILKENFRIGLRRKAKIIERMKTLSNGLWEFYEKFNPPMRADNGKDSWFHIYFTIFITSVFVIGFFSNKFRFGLNVIALASVLEFGIGSSFFEFYEVRKFQKFENKSNSSTDTLPAEKLLTESHDLNWFFLRISIAQILIVLLINEFLVSNISPSISGYVKIEFYILAFVVTFYFALIASVLYSRVYSSIEFIAMKEFLSSYDNDIIVMLEVNISRNKFISTTGKLVAIGKYLYLHNAEDFFQDIDFNEIKMIGIKEITKE